MSDSKRDDLFDFDVTGMWRLFTDVQRLGFETAASVARRFGQLVDEDLGPRWGVSREKRSRDGEEDPTPPPEDRLGETVQTAMDAYADLMQASWDAFNAVMDLTLDMSRPWVRGLSRDRVELQATAGASAKGSFYLHNTSTTATGEVEVTTDGLIGPGGKTLRADAIKLEPSRIESIAPGGTQEVAIEVEVGDEVGAGRYVGQLRATTEPVTQLDLAVVVGPDEG